VTALVPSALDDRSIEGLRARVAALDARLRERAAEVERVTHALAAFTIRYRQQVGLLHEELDELEFAIAEAEEDVDRARMPSDSARTTKSSDGPRPEPRARLTTDAVRKLFRDVAKAIHPDLAEDESARDRRHALMIEANRAYLLGDEERLRAILELWDRSPEAVQGDDPEADRLRLVRRVAQIEEQLAAYAGDLEALRDSPMWKLKAMVDEAAGRGTDLIRDMVLRLKRDILVARNRLAAIRSTP
jgi:hypothetical protein